MRIKTKWHNKKREVTIEERANTMAFISWRIATALVLNLENEDFQTDTQKQRLDVIAEALAFLVSVTDRMVAPQLTQEGRQEMITLMALKLAKDFQDNCHDLIGEGDFKSPFIDTLNARLNGYAECNWDDEKQLPGFQYKRDFGNHVAEVMGERDNKWITTQVIDIEVPDMLETLTKAKNQMVDGRSEAAVGE